MRISCALLPVFCLIPGAGLADETASATMSTIARAWKNRENRVSTLDCEWSGQQVWGAKTQVYYDEKGARYVLPSNDHTVTTEGRFRLHGDKMRYESSGPQPIQETGSFETRGYVSVTDGIDQKSFFDKEKGAEGPRFPPVGFIGEKVTLPDTLTIHLWPLLMLYRSSAPDVVAAAVDLRKFSPKGPITIAGRECLLLERTTGGVEKQELVIDMKRDSVPVRIRSLSRDGSAADGAWYAAILIEIDYIDHGDGTWNPSGWKTAFFGERGRLLEQMKAVVKRCDLNTDIPDSVFRFDFPVGTKVSNRKTREHYLLREGGEKRPITQAEANARVSYKQLLETNPGGALGYRGRFWLVLSLIVTAGLLLLLVRRISMRRKIGPNP